MENQNNESFFSFRLGNGIFSVPVTYVQEVFEFETITKVPNSLPYLKGVMNVRGSVVAIADLRGLFNFNPSEDLNGTSIIVLEIPRKNNKPSQLGIITDQVDVVSPLNLIQAESTNYGIPEDKAGFVRSVARRGDDFILILDVPEILNFIENDVDKTVTVDVSKLA